MLSKLASLALISSIITFLPLGQAQAQAQGPRCRELVIPVTIKGRNIDMPSNGLGFITVSNIISGAVQGLF
jgi:hypothetical protein